ncbi:UbiH/UbiF family hydroxylase [Salinarimonas soli]|uniref:UbiH/UbiF family hydroxylase n=1 Tax=Salinarimonas soli TaxID=1638099 RepID=A0A5B2VQP2_9HYPH|nr:UbiH/UbiF family hydroxylase [Salinarimonas soli]KAA2241084.1 UbiH/UbiF family hydroxylase [Salinarimonas soli]
MPDATAEIAVVGAGAAGLAAALAFHRAGFDTVLVGLIEPRADGRTVALLDGSVRMLRRLGAWERLRDDAAPLETMRLVDDTGSLFRPPPVAFQASEIGLEAFGWNVESARLVRGLGAVLEETELRRIDAGAEGYSTEEDGAVIALAGGGSVRAGLVVAADGWRSVLRSQAGIKVREWSYPQAALTTILAHDRDHREISTEFHTRHGPFTLVPLPGRRSSLVWVTNPVDAERLGELDDAGLALTIERQAHSILGAMRIDGPRGLVPMTGLSVDRYGAGRLALVGEAAHVFPPIGAQGLNLGLRDVAALVDAVCDAREAGEDIGGEGALRRYQRGRDLDVRLRTTAVHALNRTLLTDFLPADLLRGAGLLVLDNIRPLRRMVMREGVLPRLSTPRLMRAEAR